MDLFNTLRPRQHGCHFADDTFKRIFLNENFTISMAILLKLVPRGPNNNIPAFVQIMAWRRPGDKPLSEPMMVSLTMHICVTRPQWVNTASMLIARSNFLIFQFSDPYTKGSFSSVEWSIQIGILIFHTTKLSHHWFYQIVNQWNHWTSQ